MIECCPVCHATLGPSAICEACDVDLVGAVASDDLLRAVADAVAEERRRCAGCYGFGHLRAKKGVVACVCDAGTNAGFDRPALTPGSMVRVSPTAGVRVVDDLDLFIRSYASTPISRQELIRAVERVTKRPHSAAESAVNKAIGSGLLEVM